MKLSRHKDRRQRTSLDGPTQRPTRYWRGSLVLVVCVLLIGSVCLSTPHSASADTPVSIELSGWGWCPAYRQVANVTLSLTGSMMPRDNATGVADLYLAGILQFNLDATTDNFGVELRGTKVRSVFFLRQVSGGTDPLMAEFEGTWLGDTDYVACEGRLAIPAPNHVAKPYVFVLRTTDGSVPSSETPGSWVQNWDFIIEKCTSAFDEIADRMVQSGEEMKRLLGDVATEVGVLFREIRTVVPPYFR